MPSLKLKQLESILSEVDDFEAPKYQLEQYKTSAAIAARALYSIEQAYGDIEGRIVGDFGTGTGILGIGCAVLGADLVVGVDMDEDAILQAVQNAEDIGVDEVMEFVRADVTTVDKLLRFGCNAEVLEGGASCSKEPPVKDEAEEGAAAAGGAGEGGPGLAAGALVPVKSPLRLFDTVVMNPPFGTRKAGVDMEFLAAGLAACHPTRGVVYSMHKSSTRAHIARTATESWGVAFEVVAELRFDIPATYAFHREAVVDVAVDLIRLSRRGGDSAVARPIAGNGKGKGYVTIDDGEAGEEISAGPHPAPASGAGAGSHMHDGKPRRVEGGSGRGRGRGGSSSSRGGAAARKPGGKR